MGIQSLITHSSTDFFFLVAHYSIAEACCVEFCSGKLEFDAGAPWPLGVISATPYSWVWDDEGCQPRRHNPGSTTMVLRIFTIFFLACWAPLCSQLSKKSGSSAGPTISRLSVFHPWPIFFGIVHSVINRLPMNPIFLQSNVSGSTTSS